MKKTAIYIRVSTDEQARSGYSVEAQKKNLTEYCKRYNFNLIDYYIDSGFSGAKLKRPELQRLVADVEQGVIDSVIVWRMDRLSRKMKHLLYLLDLFEKNDVNFYSMTENFDAKTPVGKLLINMLGSIAEFERESIIQRINAVKETRKMKKKLPLGNPPLGYKIENNQFIYDEKAHVIKKIFEMYIYGYKPKKIASVLNQEGYRTKDGNIFTRASVWRIVKNHTYAGLIEINGKLVKGNIEPIVDEQTFYQAQKIIESRRIEKKKNPEKHLLTGLIYCKCGSTMHSNASSNKRRYKCSAKVLYFSDSCDSKGVKADFIEYQVASLIQDIIKNNKSELLNPFLEKYNEMAKQQNKISEEISFLNRKKAELDQKLNKYFEAFEEGEIDNTVLKNRLNNLKQQKEQIEKKLLDLKLKSNEIDSIDEEKEKIKALLEQFEILWEVSDLTDKKKILSVLIEKIVVFDDYIDIYFTTGYQHRIKIEQSTPNYFIRPLEKWEVEVLKNTPTKKAKALLMLADGRKISEVAHELQVDFSKIQWLVRSYNKTGIKTCFVDFKTNMKIEFEDYVLENIEKLKHMTFDELMNHLQEKGYSVASNKLKNFWYKHFVSKKI
ncbi:MAG: site-specific recombinase [Deferribacteres bacterium]|jgi:site-specific DNA recombinase|nr:site-specific recombinase [Deferribacteres bacterium]